MVGVGRGIASLELLALSRFLRVCSPVNIDHFANPGASGPVQMDLPERAWAPSHFVAPACVPLTQSLGRTLGRDKQHMSHHFCQRFQGFSVSVGCLGLSYDCQRTANIFTATVSGLVCEGAADIFTSTVCILQVYHVKGRFGWATSDFTPRGKIIERTSYRKYSCLCLLTVTVVLAYMS